MFILAYTCLSMLNYNKIIANTCEIIIYNIMIENSNPLCPIAS